MKNEKEMNILVTGGAGFIGSHIVDAYIEQGHHVTIVDNMSSGNKRNINPKAYFLQADINDTKTMKELFEFRKNHPFDIINHHAAQISIRISVDDPSQDATDNIIGSLKLYELGRRYGVKKIIFASSGGSVYGDTDDVPTKEDHILEPISPYAIGKMTNEKYLKFYKETHGIDYAILRYSNVYGPRQNGLGEAAVIAIFNTKMLTGQQPIINGDGTTIRDYVYVSDVVKANVMALQDDFIGIYNIGTSVATSTNDIFYRIRAILEKENEIEEVHGPGKPGEQKLSLIDYSLIKKHHGWKPDVHLLDGLKKTSDYFKDLYSES